MNIRRKFNNRIAVDNAVQFFGIRHQNTHRCLTCEHHFRYMRAACGLAVKAEPQTLSSLRFQNGSLPWENQVAGDLRARICKDVADLPFLGNMTAVNHCHSVADMVNNLHFMCNNHNRDAEFLVDFPQKVEDSTRGIRIKRRSCLIAQDVLGICCKSPCNCNTLLLSAGQL